MPSRARPPPARGLPDPLPGDDLILWRTGFQKVAPHLLLYSARNTGCLHKGREGGVQLWGASLPRHPQGKDRAVSLPLCGSRFGGHQPVVGALQLVTASP